MLVVTGFYFGDVFVSMDFIDFKVGQPGMDGSGTFSDIPFSKDRNCAKHCVLCDCPL